MDNWIEPPPRQQRSGCFGKGCLIFFVLVIVFAIALVGGAYYGVRHYYLASEPMPLATPPPTEEAEVTRENPQEVTQRIETFKAAARQAQPAQAGLSAGDINALIDRNSRSRGTAVVTIEGETARVQMSVPMNRFDLPWQRSLGLSDRYLNAQFSVHSPPNGNIANLAITDLVVNNHVFPGDALDFRVMGKSPRDYLLKYAQKYNVSSLQIIDGKVVLDSNTIR